MKIQHNRTQNTQTSFKGYDARPLKGLFFRYTTTIPQGFEKVMVQLEQIGKKQGFDVFVQGNNGIVSHNMSTLSEQITPINGGSSYTWVQDNLTFLNHDMLANPKVVTSFNSKVAHFFGFPEKIARNHSAGGNYFVVNKNGKKELLLGDFDREQIDKLASELGVDYVKTISQADFHLDLFIRPLKDNVILVADDTILRDRVAGVIQKIETDETLLSNSKLKKVCSKLKEIRTLLNIMNMEVVGVQYSPMKKVQEELVDAGYKVVKVPGRIFDYINADDGLLPSHILNFMNGIAHVNKDNELVYITNKSNVNKYCGITESVAEKIGFDFDSEFINSVKDYIKPENIYFVDTKRFLKDYQGGIHCLCAEIPKFEAKA